MDHTQSNASNERSSSRDAMAPDGMAEMGERHGLQSDLDTVGDIGMSGEGARAGASSMGTDGGAEMGEIERTQSPTDDPRAALDEDRPIH